MVTVTVAVAVGLERASRPELGRLWTLSGALPRSCRCPDGLPSKSSVRVSAASRVNYPSPSPSSISSPA